MIVIASDLTLFSAVKEVFALQKIQKRIKSNYHNNQLIQDLLADTSDAEKTTQINEIKNSENFADFLENVLEKLKAAVAIANIKATPIEAQEYKEFLYEIANASGEGIFGTGHKVSQKESPRVQ